MYLLGDVKETCWGSVSMDSSATQIAVPRVRHVLGLHVPLKNVCNLQHLLMPLLLSTALATENFVECARKIS